MNTQWVFGSSFFSSCGEERHVLQEHVLPGTTVISNLWRAYSTVRHIGYMHTTVNHNVHFVDPQTGATTNHGAEQSCATRKSVVPAGHFYVLI